jgi:Fe-S cluster assembly protein SufD
VTTPGLLGHVLPDARRAGGAASRWLQEHGLPTDRDEAWRCTPTHRLLATAYAPPTGSPGFDAAALSALVEPGPGPQIVCVNGCFSAGLSTLDRLPPGLRCVDLGPAPRTRRLDTARPDGFRLLNEVAGVGGAGVLVDADRRLDDPVLVVHVTVPGPEPTIVHPRLHIIVRARSRVLVTERYVGHPGTGLTNAATTIVAGRGAEVVHQRVQDEPEAVDHLGHTSLSLTEGARVRSTSVLLGGGVARSATDAVLRGDRTGLVLRGLSLGSGRQHHDHLATVEHAGSGSPSDQLFRSVVDDHARASFGGHVIVRPGTTGTTAHQMSRSLVLARTAEAASRPWLEILADDVRCTHGAAVGRLDEDAMFYLRSRGIPRARAREVLITAFMADIVDDLQPRPLREHLEERARRWRSAEEAA